MKKALEFFDGDEFAASTFLNKYALRDKDGNILEEDPNQTILRVMKVLADAMPEEYPSEEFLKRVLKEDYNPFRSDRRYNWLDIFIHACNKFKGVCPQGSILSAAGNDEFPQSLSNCFVIPSPHDSMAGIMKSGEQEAQLMKRRGGVGLDISSLRPKNSGVANAARTSSGAVGWMEHFSNVCRAVGQNGRRGALMISLSIKHPDAEEFAKIKKDRSKVTGANVSLRISDEFMNAVYNDTSFTQRFPLEGAVETEVEVKAKELWKSIIECAHDCAEPGLLFWDNCIKNLPAHCYPEFKSVSTNPCVTGDTWVLTDKGPKQVKNLLGEPFTAIVNGVSYKSSNLGFWFTGIKEVFEVKTNKGFILKTTNNHKLKKINLTRYERLESWVELKDLNIGDKISLSNHSNFEWEGKGSYNLGWLLGNLKGDGNLDNKNKHANLDYWGETKYTMKDHATSLLKSCFKVRSDLGSGGCQEGYDRVRLGSVKLYHTALEFGLSTSKELLPELENTSSSFHKGFIQGLFDADGSVQGTQEKGVSIRLTSVDLNSLKIVQRMLSRLGIISSIFENRRLPGLRTLPDGKQGSKEYPCQATHELIISNKNIETFRYYIGFKDPKKFTTLNFLLENYNRELNRERFCDKIIEIKSTGFEPVYDCTIPVANCFDGNGIEAHNCAEIILSPYDSCRLITICLTNYVRFAFTKNTEFDFVAFEKDVRIAMRMMDAVVSAEIQHVDKILDKVKANQKEDFKNADIYNLEIELWKNIRLAAVNGRRTGLGTHGLGDTLAQLCLKYDRDDAISMVDKIYSSLRNFAYDESVEMAKEMGPFPIYDFEKEQSCDFIKRLPEELLAKMKRYGRRNIAILTNAPTGSISILSQVSSGIEPTFRQVYTRRRKINQKEQDARVDFIDSLGDKWTEFPIFEKNVQRYLLTKGLDLPTTITEDKLDELLPSYFVTSDKINWKKRVEIQATAQQYIDHSIASTLNLPHYVTVEEVAEVYEYAHKMGLKGVTVYRDGCRSGVLISQETHKKQKEAGRPETLVRQEAPKRPKSLPCEVHITTVGKEEYVVIVSFLGDSIYEVFAGKHKNHLPEKKFSGEMIKQKEGIYILKYEHKGHTKEVDVNKYFKNDQYAALTRLVSTALRHGTPISFIIEQLMKSTESFSGFDKSLARILKKYAKKEDLARKILANSGTDDIEVKFEDGCMTVINHTKNTVESKCD